MVHLDFQKYQGLGNHFIVLERDADDGDLASDLVVALCDPHVGVGADGILVFVSSATDDGEGVLGTMVIHNADGSYAAMCGNGLRCVLAYLDRTSGGRFGRTLPPVGQMAVIRVAGRDYRCGRDPAVPGEYLVEMGAPRLNEDFLPPADDGDSSLVLEAGGKAFAGHRLSMGNPHFVVMLAGGEGEPMDFACQYGPLLCEHPAFPDRANISFARVLGERDGAVLLEAVVFERGVGITQACGSGACAIGYTAARDGSGRAKGPEGDGRYVVRLPGGELRIGIGVDGGISMSGPATMVFEGHVPLGNLKFLQR